MLIKIFVRTFPSAEDCELFESILETRWPNLLQEVKGVRFRALKNPQTPNVSVVLWEFPDNEAMKMPNPNYCLFYGGIVRFTIMVVLI